MKLILSKPTAGKDETNNNEKSDDEKSYQLSLSSKEAHAMKTLPIPESVPITQETHDPSSQVEYETSFNNDIKQRPVQKLDPKYPLTQSYFNNINHSFFYPKNHLYLESNPFIACKRNFLTDNKPTEIE